MPSQEAPEGAPRGAQPGSTLAAAASGQCPRCGARTLFAGPIRFASRCPACGLDFDAFNVGDGPAAFLTLAVGAIVAALAIWLQLAVAPPFWVHVVLWVPLSLALVVGGLRVTKGWLLHVEYRRSAAEARRKDP